MPAGRCGSASALSDPPKGIFTLILQGTDGIESLVGNLLRFPKKGEYRRESVLLQPLLMEAVLSAAGSWPGEGVTTFYEVVSFNCG